jgi:xylulokinase
VGCGRYKNVEEACAKLIKVIHTTKQDNTAVDLYDKKYEIFKDLYPGLKLMFERIAKES